ncbi:hypothetical protein [Nocardiopsis ganjiahuensis]|uniref:hypothetical protein n=1 Tax=Nocardiopsis ganjiahuensis TaxID=239984 RepID=UPI00034A80C8|nr:hypothetical protein [Nocardiopsis ganjiahuensis]
MHPLGPTHLAEAVLDALGGVPERVVVVSDGHDSEPALLADTLLLWRQRLDPDRATTLVHLNPVLDAAGTGLRTLSPAVPTIGLHDPATLPSLVELARFREGRLGLADLRAHMDAAAAAYLSSFRLSPAQIRRGHLLRVLDESGWRTDLAARALGTGHGDLVTRLERTGLAYLLNPDVLLQHRSARLRRIGRRTP